MTAKKTERVELELDKMHVGDWQFVPMGHPVGVFRGGKYELMGRVVDVDVAKSTITLECKAKSRP